MTRVIVVDDDKDICELVHHRLTVMGMRVDCHFDGESGLRAIETDPPDLAIIDVLMPRMNGLEVVRAIRSNQVLNGLPIVLFSALGTESDLQAGLAAGAQYYVIKPFSILALGA